MAGTKNRKYRETRATLQFVLQRLEDAGSAARISDMGKDVSWTHGDLARAICEHISGFDKKNVPAGAPVGLLAPNSPEWIAVALALCLSGRVPVPMDTLMSGEDLAHVISDSGIAYILTVKANLPLLDEMEAAQNLDVILIDADGEEAGDRGALSLDELRGEPSAQLPELCPDDRAALFYTSGTTGSPKGVPLTHENLASNLGALMEGDIIRGRERAVLPLPLFHIYPFTLGMLLPLSTGCDLIFPAGLSGPEIVRSLERKKGTVLIGVPRLYEMLTGAIKQRMGGGIKGGLFNAALRLSISVRAKTGFRLGKILFRPLHTKMGPALDVAASGGAKLDPDTAWMLEGLGWEVLTGYGLTETSPVISYTPRASLHPASAGRPLDMLETRIDDKDETGQGELLVRGPSVFEGYHNLPDETAESFTGEGWFRTGDRVYEDSEGYFYIGARMSEMIVLPGGKNVARPRVESHYSGHEDIEEAALLEKENRLAAIVVPSQDAISSARDPDDLGVKIDKALEERGRGLASYERVGDFVISRKSLPRTPMGKIRRHKIDELYEDLKQGRTRDAEEELSASDKQLLSRGAARDIWDWLRNQYFADRPVFMDADLGGDMGLDSLGRMDMTFALQEKFGIRLSEKDMAGIATIRDLLEAALAEDREDDDSADRAAQNDFDRRKDKWLRPRTRTEQIAHSCLYYLDKGLCRLFFRLRVKGAPDAGLKGPLIIAPNHTSYLDPLVLAASLPTGLARRIWWAGYEPLLASTAPRRLFAKANNIFPVDPARRPESSLKLAREVLERDRILIWFPEGERSQNGEVGHIREGIVRLVQETGAPVLPVQIEGTWQAWPPGQRLPRPGRVTLAFGKRMEFSENDDGDTIRTRIYDALTKRSGSAV